MSIIKRFGDLFIASCPMNISLHVRALLPIALFLTTAVSISIRERGAIFIVYGYSVIIFALYLCRALTKSLRGLMLPMIFIVIGFAVHLLSWILDYPMPSIYTLMLSSFKLALIFLSVTLFFQWVSFREIKYVLTKIGLSSIASHISIALTITPMLSTLYSESYIAAILKFGKKKAYKAIKPLVIQSAILAKDLAQAIYLYGIPIPRKVVIKKPSLIEILLFAVTIVVSVCLLVLAP